MYSKANQKNTVGFVLHAVPYQENSLLVDAITADFGRISFVARGAKSKRSSLKAALQVFVPLKLTLGGMDKSLKTLVRCEVSGRQFQYIPPVLFSALYANELIAALYRIEDNSQILFAAYLDVMTHLEEGYPESWALRQFELVLLEELGYGIDLSFDSSSGVPIMPRKWYVYQSGTGFREIIPGMIGGVSMNDAYNGADIIALRTGENLSPHAMQAMKNLIKKNLDILLEGKVLYSRELYRDYLNVGKSSPEILEKIVAESSGSESDTGVKSGDEVLDKSGATEVSDSVGNISAFEGNTIAENENRTGESQNPGLEPEALSVAGADSGGIREAGDESPDPERDENFDL